MKNPNEGADILQEIRTYENDVCHYNFRPAVSQCPRCNSPAEGPVFFRRHEIRERSFLVVIGDLVQKILSVISRWKCPVCKKTFTYYPPFALPHKRYVLPVIKERSQRCLEDDSLTYRSAVEENGRPIFHEREEGEPISADSTEEEKENEQIPAIAHTTLYRWISSLGNLQETVRKAHDLIKQKNPATTLFREIASFSVASRKHLSESRKRLLNRASSLFPTDAAYIAIFGLSIFPNLATVTGWS